MYDGWVFQSRPGKRKEDWRNMNLYTSFYEHVIGPITMGKYAAILLTSLSHFRPRDVNTINASESVAFDVCYSTYEWSVS